MIYYGRTFINHASIFIMTKCMILRFIEMLNTFDRYLWYKLRQISIQGKMSRDRLFTLDHRSVSNYYCNSKESERKNAVQNNTHMIHERSLNTLPYDGFLRSLVSVAQLAMLCIADYSVCLSSVMYVGRSPFYPYICRKVWLTACGSKVTDN